MRRDLVTILRCPRSGQPLELASVASEVDGDVETGVLATHDRAHQYEIRGFVPRFVPAENYAESFGFQWNRFSKTQLDSTSGTSISRDRFYSYSGWSPDELKGKLVLDVGCGTGRFSEIALAAGARVVAIDYSSAVDACRANFAGEPRLNVVQADIHALPFNPGSFDYVYCLGVLQHTPDPRRSFLALPAMVAPGGKLTADVYPRLKLNVLWPKYWLRHLTRHISPERLFGVVESSTPAMLGVSRLLNKVPVIGRWLKYAVPVVNYEGVYPLDGKQLREWAVLDTFDMLSPKFDNPQTAAELEGWLADSGLVETSVRRMGFLVLRGRKLQRGAT